MSGSTGLDDAQEHGLSSPPRKARKRSRVLRWLALGVGLALVAGSVTVWLGYRKLNQNIRTDTVTPKLLGPTALRPSVLPIAYNSENILIIGSDSRDGANSQYGDPGGGARSDTTILLHLSKDRRSAVAMSIPRDAMVQIPSCAHPDGTHTAAQFAQFNWAFEFGGTACTIRTVENLTGIRIDHFMVIDFQGFKKMVNAIGGVPVCLSKPINDPDAKLTLPAGRQIIQGSEALGFVRARYTLGDGSDTERMGRQQLFLTSLVQKVKSNGVLYNPAELYPLLDAATSSITVDPGLNSVSKLYDLASSVKDLPPSQTVFLTAPREPYVNDPNRDQFQQPQADQLFTELRDDQPIQLTGAKAGVSTAPPGTTAPASAASAPASSAASAPSSATASDTASATATAGPGPSSPTFTGRAANQDICTGS